MKAIIDYNKIPQKMDVPEVYLNNAYGENDIRIVDYEFMARKGLFIISLCSELFFEDRFKVAVRHNRINIILSEFIENTASSLAKYDWQGYSKQSYVRMRNVSLLLPGDNFYLLRHFLIPEKFLLKIILGYPVEN